MSDVTGSVRTELRFRVRDAEQEMHAYYTKLPHTEFIIGRSAKRKDDADYIFTNDQTVSRKHCKVFWQAGRGWVLHDLGSENGTRVNDEKISAPVRINDGVTISIGHCLIWIAPVTDLNDETMAAPGAAAGGSALDEDDATLVANGDEDEATTVAEDDTVAITAKKVRAAVAASESDLEDATSISEEETTLTDGRTKVGDRQTVAARGRAGASDDKTVAADADATTATDEETVVATSDTAARRAAPGRDNGSAVPRFRPAFPKSGVFPVLLEKNLIDEAQVPQLQLEAAINGKTLFRTLVESDANEHKLDAIYEAIGEFEHLDVLNDPDQLFENADKELPEWFDLGQAAHYGVMLLASEEESGLHYVTADPYNLPGNDWVQRGNSGPVRKSVAKPQVVQAALEQLKNSRGEGEGFTVGNFIDIDEESETRIRENFDKASAREIVNYFLHRAASKKASDIHIEPSEDSLVVRVRIDGVLHQDIDLPMAYSPIIISRLKIMGHMDVAEKRRPQDGRISVQLRGNPLDVRVSTFPTVYGEKIVLRLLDQRSLQALPEALNLVARDHRILKDASAAPFGLIMLCGPTGSGKTTTLYACLGGVDRKKKNVVTVEDPVEYRLEGVHQMQVNHKIGLSFASGLRNILRQDPDVIMVGECRDEETAAMAIQASLTGHLVYSTIHTNDAVGVITRLIDMNIAPYLVASSLSVAMAQRLVRKLCPHCKSQKRGAELLPMLLNDEGISAERLQELGIEIHPKLSYPVAGKCSQCRETGYIGRQGVYEVFRVTNEARAIISALPFREKDLRAHARESGMTTLVSHGLDQVDRQTTTLSEVIRVLGEMA